MLIEVSKEEADKRRKEVRELRLFSKNPRDRIIGILMDTTVGDVGLYRENAEAKADEILKEFTLFSI